MRRIFSSHRLALPLALLCLTLTAGCFDYELELELTKTGHGSVSVELRMPEQVAQAHDVATLDTLIWPRPQRQRQVVDGVMVFKERNTFDNLDDLAARRMLIYVKEIGTGIAGMGDYAYRVTINLEMAEGDLPDRDVLPGFEQERRAAKDLPDDPALRRARDLRARSLAGHYLTVAIKFPGKLSQGLPLVVGSSKVEPVSEQGGSRVAWKVPLSVLFNENARDTLVFNADFKGYMVFRAYEQKDARSHYPDPFEEALGRGENIPGGRAQFNRMQQGEQQKQQELLKQQREQQLQQR